MSIPLKTLLATEPEVATALHWYRSERSRLAEARWEYVAADRDAQCAMYADTPEAARRAAALESYEIWCSAANHAMARFLAAVEDALVGQFCADAPEGTDYVAGIEAIQACFTRHHMKVLRVEH